MPVSVACSKVNEVLPLDADRPDKALSCTCKTLSGVKLLEETPTLPPKVACTRYC